MMTIDGSFHDEDAWKATYLELQRVLHVMAHDSYKITQSTPATWYQARAEHCMSLWHQLQQQHMSSSYDGHGHFPQARELEERVYQEYQRSNQVTAGVLSGGVSARESIRQLLFQGQAQQQNGHKRKGAVSTTEIDGGDDASDDDGSHDGAAVLPVTPDCRRSSPRSNINSADSSPEAAMPSPRELQEQQREQMEEAIRHMASQMKLETARIHQTLKSQSKNLDALETVTSENVDAVSKVTEDVQQHVQKSWTKTLGTWTVLLTLVGIFAFTLVTILMAPKRRDMPCIFFCPDDNVKHHSIPPSHYTPEYENDQTFCRVMRDGTKECISEDTRASWNNNRQRTDSPKTDNERMSDQKDMKNTNVPPESSCEMDVNGECLPDEPDKTTPSNGRGGAKDELDELLNQLGSDDDTAADEETKPDPNQYLDESVRKMLERAQKVQRAKEAAEARMEESMRASKSNYGNVETPDTISVDDLIEKKELQGGTEKINTFRDPSKVKGENKQESSMETPDPISDHNSVEEEEEEEEKSIDDSRDTSESGRADPFEDKEVVEPEIQNNGNVQDHDPFEAKYHDNRHAPSGDPLASRNVDAVPANDPFASRRPVEVTKNDGEHLDQVPLYEGKPFSPREVRRAAAKGELRVITEYLKIRPDWASKADGNGWSAWHLAARSGHVHVIKLLLDLNPEGASQTTRDGRTARGKSLNLTQTHFALLSSKQSSHPNLCFLS